MNIWNWESFLTQSVTINWGQLGPLGAGTLFSIQSHPPNIGNVLQRSHKKTFTLYCTLYSNMNSGFILQNVRRSNAGEKSNWWKMTKSKMFSWVVRNVHCLYPFFCVICMPADASQSLPAPAIQYLSSISLLSICASQKAIGRSFAASVLQNTILYSPISSVRGRVFHRHDITLFI